MAWVYLVRNGGLHKIGRTDNLERRMKQIQPCKVVQNLETDRSRDLEYELHQKFKRKRLPQTEYFRLSENEVQAARKALGWKPPQPDPEAEAQPEPEPQHKTSKTGKTYWVEGHVRNDSGNNLGGCLSVLGVFLLLVISASIHPAVVVVQIIALGALFFAIRSCRKPKRAQDKKVG